MDLQTQMKQIVADAAVREVEDGMILGLGSGSTAALMIKSLAEQIRLGKLKNIKGVPTSFQSEVLALELNIPLIDLASVPCIDLAIDGADEVDPDFQLIKGGGACHVREKLVASKANKLLIVIDESKLVQSLNQVFPLPVEVMPSAWKQVKDIISEMGGVSNLRMAIKKANSIRRHGRQSEDSINGLIQSLGIDGLERENHFNPNKDDISDWFGGSTDCIKRS